ncbi:MULTISPECIES: ABC transporter permease [unclassified Fusibacter]|uniref:ABC transporter permease n=1 Tax=unclassified Fusibacter TaxID=2624464 RepID=UPI001012822C|nr:MULTISPECIES: ABC transporter permease [unclassified Fusibacter]MCK8061219.1 ABC transporter permease [Fusibacter sp. A2]NPE23437.1 ABC transporter permease [Fusibacter sp. A1]RXV59216.1 hypothetical protein DWB64_16600 [Fusibacter sp. A1]
MKSKLFLLILSFTLIAYNAVWYQGLSGNYNKNTLIATVDDILLSRVDMFVEKSGVVDVMVNYQRGHGSGTLYMQSGYLGTFETIDLLYGSWTLDDESKNIIIGEDIADAYYSQLTCIGRTFVMAGKEYKVVGVVNDSDDIYIGFDESLQEGYWDMKHFLMLPPKGMDAEEYIDLAAYDLSQNMIAYSQLNLVKWQMDVFGNSAWIIGLGVLAYAVATWIRLGLKTWRGIAKHYMAKRNDTDFIEIVKPIWQDITFLLILIAGSLVTARLILYGLGKLSISSNYLPQNLLSVESYYELFKRHFNGIVSGMRYGMDTLQITSIWAVVGEIALSLAMSVTYLLRFSWNEHLE